MRQNSPFSFYVGGYAEKGQKGILKCSFDPESASFGILDACEELRNPSWLLHHPGKPLLYAVEELSPEGSLAVLSEADGHLKVQAVLTTRGADPCHISITPDEGHLLVSNYNGGSLAVYALDADGIPAQMTDFVQHRMEHPQGGNPVRQEAPHIHFSSCDGRQVYVNDLGLNRVFLYDWEPEQGRLRGPVQALEFPEAAGPRHLAFSGDGRFLYVLCELNATLHVFRRNGDSAWQRIQVVSTVPEGAHDFERYTWSIAAAIHFADPRTLCTSTRGLNCLAVFAVGDDGTLRQRQMLSSEGVTPRDFMPAGDFLLAANQGSDAVQAFQRVHDAYIPLHASLKALQPTCLCR